MFYRLARHTGVKYIVFIIAAMFIEISFSTARCSWYCENAANMCIGGGNGRERGRWDLKYKRHLAMSFV